MPRNRAPFSAQVILATPLPEDSARAQSAFQALGFKTGPTVGGSFSIEGPGSLFRECFGVDLVYAAGGVHRRGQKAALSSLPISRLAPSLQGLVRQVLFTAPPAFGPGTMP